MQVEAFSGTAAEWNSFIADNDGDLKQTYEWGAFRTELKWGIQRLRVKDGDQVRLAALVLEKPLPVGYSFYYCPEGPAVLGNDWNDQQNQAAFQVLSEYLKRQKGSKVLFLKVDPPQRRKDFPLPWLTDLGFTSSPEHIQPAVVAHVDLTGTEDEVLARMKQKGRYNVRYAAKKGVTVRSGTSAEDLSTFYMLLEQTAKRQGITHRSRHYFELFRKHFMEESDLASFFIAEYEGKPVAVTLMSFFGHEAIYLYGGSSTDDRNVFGSYAIQWAAMQEAKRRGCTNYHMTGIAHSDDPGNAWAGLRQFKLKFGAEVVELVGARDQQYHPALYKLFTNADRVRRRLAKLTGRARTQ
jgi:lipid II:glycine glycyltransferase (peptidoglycan interpeptide bridge formation enzyme)